MFLALLRLSSSLVVCPLAFATEWHEQETYSQGTSEETLASLTLLRICITLSFSAFLHLSLRSSAVYISFEQLICLWNLEYSNS
jgi:hypothetical protein